LKDVLLLSVQKEGLVNKTYIANPPSHHAIGFRERENVNHMISFHTNMLMIIIHEVPGPTANKL
jgi:hypothetical protein